MLPHTTRQAIAKKNPRQLVDVTDRRRLCVHPCSESTISLANVMKKGESAEAGAVTSSRWERPAAVARRLRMVGWSSSVSNTAATSAEWSTSECHPITRPAVSRLSFAQSAADVITEGPPTNSEIHSI
jgi:hypothetical protein